MAPRRRSAKSGGRSPGVACPVGYGKREIMGDPNPVGLVGAPGPLDRSPEGLAVVRPGCDNIEHPNKEAVFSTLNTNVLVHLSTPFVMHIDGLTVVNPESKVNRFREKSRKKRKERRREERVMKKESVRVCEPCGCMYAVSESHCTCTCRGFNVDGGELNLTGVLMDVERVGVISTEEQVEGRVGLEVGDKLANISMPVLDEPDRERAGKGQIGELSDFIREQLAAGQNAPAGAQTLQYTAEQLSILNNISSFRMNSQNIILRIFIKPGGDIFLLIWIEGEELPKIVTEVHLATAHSSGIAVLILLEKKYYTTGLRNKVRDLIRQCVKCIKYRSRGQ